MHALGNTGCGHVTLCNSRHERPLRHLHVAANQRVSAIGRPAAGTLALISGMPWLEEGDQAAPVVVGDILAPCLLMTFGMSIGAPHVPQLHALVLPVADEMHAVAPGIDVRDALCRYNACPVKGRKQGLRRRCRVQAWSCVGQKPGHLRGAGPMQQLLSHAWSWRRSALIKVKFTLRGHCGARDRDAPRWPKNTPSARARGRRWSPETVCLMRRSHTCDGIAPLHQPTTESTSETETNVGQPTTVERAFAVLSMQSTLTCRISTVLRLLLCDAGSERNLALDISIYDARVP